MGRKNQQQALMAGPPAELLPTQKIGLVDTMNGNNIYTVLLPDLDASPEKAIVKSESAHLVELPPRFRNSMWIRRGGFVLIDCAAFEGRENKLTGEIMTVIHDEKSWRKMPYWPVQFKKEAAPMPSYDSDSEDGSMTGGNLNRRRYDSSEDE